VRLRIPAAIALSVVAACPNLGGVRPLYGPVPGSLGLELNASPDVVIAAAARDVVTVGLRVSHVAANEGYLETEWFDLGAHRSVAASARDLDRVVKLRFFADPTAGKTHLAAECVRRIADDPSVPPRDLERMVPDSTAGRVLLDSIVARLKTEFPAPPPAPTPGTSPGP
jgi:hypothetical protein